MRTSTAPTASVSPSAPPSSTMRPAYGLGISTSALLVSTVHSVWLSSTSSPTATLQLVIVASSRPSPRSGTRKSRTIFGLAHGAPSLSRRSRAAGRRRAATASPAAQADTGCRNRWRATPAPPGRRTAPPGCGPPTRRRSRGCAAPSCIDHGTPGLAHRRRDGVEVQRDERAQVDDLQAPAVVVGGQIRCCERGVDQAAVGEHGDVVADAAHRGPADGQCRACRCRRPRAPSTAAWAPGTSPDPGWRSSAAAASRRPTESTAPPLSGPRCAPSTFRWTPNGVRPHRFRRTTGCGP